MVNKEVFHFFKNIRPTIVLTKVKDPINAAINTVSATDARGSPITATNIEYTIIRNPINANRPKTIDLISLLLPFSNVDPFLSTFDSLVSFSGLTVLGVD